MHILIVDDTATNQRLLCAILESEGHEVMKAADGKEAMKVLERERVDAVISDILMPQMDGYRFCYEVRSNENFHDLPFIFYTSSYTSPSDEKLALEMGADMFLTKPAPASEIIQALHEVTTRKRLPFLPAEPSRELNLMKEYNQQLVAKLEEKNTELTVRNEELLRSEQKLLLQSTALETAANAVVITDRVGIILWVNPAFISLTGYTADEAIGRTPSLLKSCQHDRGFYLNLWTIILSGRTWRGSFTNRRKDGTLYDDEQTITPVCSQKGAITHFIAVMSDVTERKKVEQALQESENQFRRLNANLEQRVADRTAELEAANKELEAFSYSVSHDLRAPLRAVDGFSQAVLEDYGAYLPEEGRRHLETIREGAQRMGVLIDDLLTFSRLSRTPLKKQEVNVNLLVRKVLKELRSEREGRQIDIQLGDLPSCQGDSALLRQAWINLISNAVKYTRHRQAAVIRIGCQVEQEENVYFVHDNGAGFDMRYVHKLFGVFQRLHRKEEFEGTGVGLAIVQRIIHRHGGRVWAEAVLDRGATFYFTLEKRLHL